MSKKQKVLVAGWIGSENLGDEAIFSSLVSTLKEFNLEITAFSINEKRTQKIHGVSTAPFDIFPHPLRFLKAISETDIIVIGGGGILQDQTSLFNPMRYLYKAALGLMLGKKVMFYAVGAGPINFSITKSFLKFILNKVHKITVRDTKSKKILEEFGVKPNLISVSFDPAISLKRLDEDETRSLLQNELKINNHKPIIGISVRHWFDTHPLIPVSIAQKLGLRQKNGQEKYLKYISNLAASIDEVNRNHKFEILFIPFWFSRDSKVADDIISKLSNTENIHKLSREYSPSELLALFSRLNFIWAMRLHACIFAATVGVPFVALSYTSKVDNFLKELEMEELSVPIDTMDKTKLIEKFNYIFKNKNNLADKLSRNTLLALEKEKINKFKFSEVLSK